MEPTSTRVDKTKMFGNGVHVQDLYLACGCVHGDPYAVAALDELLTSVAPSRMNLDFDQLDELRQCVRVTLLTSCVAKGAQGIAQYSGRGSLRGWTRVCLMCEALTLLRREARHETELDAVLLGASREGDPELEYLRRRFRPEFEGALRAAISALSPRERNFL